MATEGGVTPPPEAGSSKLYRDPRKGVFFGVCAGIADALGLSAVGVRIGVLFVALLFAPTFFIYLALILILPKRPYPNLRDLIIARVEQLGREFAAIEQGLEGLEDYVTSDAFSIQSRMRRGEPKR